MKGSKQHAAPEERLERAVKELRTTLEEMPRKYDYAFFFSPGKRFFLAFLKGIAYGLGVATAVAIVIPFVLAFMQSVDWVPIFGDFLSNVATHLQEQQVQRR